MRLPTFGDEEFWDANGEGATGIARPCSRSLRRSVPYSAANTSAAARIPDSTAPSRYPCESCDVCSPAK